MLYGQPETSQFLAAMQRLRRQLRKQQQQLSQARQRAREALRKKRDH